MNITDNSSNELNNIIHQHSKDNKSKEPIPKNGNISDNYTINQIRHEYLQQRMKSDFTTGIEHWLHYYQDLYQTYFVTFTFREPNYIINQESNKFFEQMTMRINNKLCVNNHQKSVVFILYPEYERKKNKLHYHGVMLIHRDTTIKFHENCFLECAFEKKKKKKSDKSKKIEIQAHTRLTDYIMNPFTQFVHEDKKVRKRLRLQYTPTAEQRMIPLSITDYRIYKTPTFEDFKRSFKYSQKHFQGYNLEYDKVMVFKKTKKNPNDKFFAQKRAENAGLL